jgi:hypothetical protein
MGRFGVVVPIGRLKILDRARLEARFGAASAAKVLSFVERQATWRRIAQLLEPGLRTLGLPSKLPDRALRKAKLRLFRSFKLLGALKRPADGARAAAP